MRDCQEQIKKVPAIVAVDAKSIYDSMHSASGPLGIEEKRTCIEMIGFQQAALRENIEVRWVHGESNLSDSLTKPAAFHQLQMCSRAGFCWKLVYDPNMLSAKKRKQMGLAPLQEVLAAERLEGWNYSWPHPADTIADEDGSSDEGEPADIEEVIKDVYRRVGGRQDGAE